jgi:mRNA-degrading endonuclease RelE of RelBE toxin-antitoxin system
MLMAEIDRYADDRSSVEVNRLTGELARLRVGRYRAILEIPDDPNQPVFVLSIGRVE